MQEWGEQEQREIAALIKHFRKNGLWKPGTGGLDDYFRAAPLLVKNTEANVIPAYGCMEVVGSVDEDGKNYVTVKKPTATGVHFLFNDHYEIEASGYGKAQNSPILRVLKNTGTVTFGNRWRPTTGQWYLTKGIGHYVIYGEDNIATNVMRVRFDTSVRFYRFNLKAAWSGTPKKASCDISELDGSDTGIDEDVFDYEEIFTDLTTGDDGYCVYQDNKLTTIQAPCGA